MGQFGDRDRHGRVTVLLHPEEAQALLGNLDLPEEEPAEDDDNRTLKAGDNDAYQVDKYTLRKRLERAADGHSAPDMATGSPGTERAAEQWRRGY